MLNILKQSAKWISLGLLLLILVGIGFEYYSRWRLERSLKNGKTFAQIKGHNIHYVKKGTGSCTVIFESGLGSDSSIWQEVQDSLSSEAVTFSYDRSGLFLSDPGDPNITNESVTDELTQLLEKTACPKPYILVGHSMGGIYLRPFIHQHANDIAGIVLVESAHPLQMKKSSPELLNALSVPPVWVVKLLVNTGIFRLLLTFQPINPEIPITHRLHVKERDFFYKSVNTTFLEAKNDTRNFEHSEKFISFGNIPLTVITGTSPVRIKGIRDPGVGNEYRQLVAELHRDLLNLSTNSRLIEATKSGHVVQIYDSELITDEIRKEIRSIDSSTSL